MNVTSFEPDQNLLVAAARYANGASAHRINGLVQLYQDRCYLGRIEEAEEAASELRREIRKVAARTSVGSFWPFGER